MLQTNEKSLSQTVITKSTILYILNCTDLLFTYTYLKTGAFYEVNLLLRPLLENAYLSILVKLILPAPLIFLLIRELKRAPNTSLKLTNLLINLVLTLYTVINILHLYYLFSYVYLLFIK